MSFLIHRKCTKNADFGWLERILWGKSEISKLTVVGDSYRDSALRDGGNAIIFRCYGDRKVLVVFSKVVT